MNADDTNQARHCYIHIPFCHHICPYCAFYKHKPGSLANAAFIEALLLQFEREKDLLAPRLDTLYLGGGTPSLLSAAHLETLFEGLASRISSETEVTLEANPATFDLKKARRFREIGINRISLGVQSFQPEILPTLGRDHTGEDAKTAFHLLREAGFENISIDLMFSIPGQDKALWQNDLEIATCQLKPDHVSCYNLTFEEDTEFLARHRDGELDADENRDADLFFQALDHLESAGFRHYEISNYARPGFESRHNRAYWSGDDYLGLGPSAVSTIAETRWKTLPDTAAWIENPTARVETETLTDEDRRLEAIALQLRTAGGIRINRVGVTNEPCSIETAKQTDPVRSLIEQGWIEIEDDRIKLTREGKALADPIAAQLA
ncbi:MAG: radical SAM family heme chaperone HemW [Verrucomicrobiales bacterium]|nr:radical SAM family heme chaperone HemW [Verrucomicrobiales bacterium]